MAKHTDPNRANSAAASLSARGVHPNFIWNCKTTFTEIAQAQLKYAANLRSERLSDVQGESRDQKLIKQKGLVSILPSFGTASLTLCRNPLLICVVSPYFGFWFNSLSKQ